MEPMIIFPAIIILILVIIILTRQMEIKRRNTLKEKAQQLGFSFTEKADMSVVPRRENFHVFSQGHSRRIRNLMQRTRSDCDEFIFDYQYTTGSGKNSHTYRQTIFLFQSLRLKLPKFALRPEHLFHKIGQVFGYQDIDIKEHPNFSGKYLLRGDDENAIRKLFTQDVVMLFDNQNKLCTEGIASALIVYQSSKRFKPEELFEKYQKSRQVFDGFRRRSEYI